MKDVNKLVEDVKKHYGNVVAVVMCGSHLCGTNSPTSDEDYTVVYTPSASSLFYEEASLPVKPNNFCDDVTAYRLKEFCRMLGKGNLQVLEAVFASSDKVLYSTPLWDELVANSDKFVSKTMDGGMGQVKSVLYSYREVPAKLNYLVRLRNRLSDFSAKDTVDSVYVHLEGSEFLDKTDPNFVMVCGKKVSRNASVGVFADVVVAQLDKLSRSKKDVDFKGVYLALKVLHQLESLFTTGRLVFPMPTRERLVAIKQGRVFREEVLSELETTYNRVKELKKTSSLQEESDSAWLYQFYSNVNKETLREYFNDN